MLALTDQSAPRRFGFLLWLRDAIEELANVGNQLVVECRGHLVRLLIVLLEELMLHVELCQETS